MSGLQNNLTLDILRKAEDGRYGVLAGVVYDGGQALAFVKAMENKKSPGILQMFPITIHQLGPSFVKYCLDL